MSTEYLEILGGVPLRGAVVASGAKNAALPQLIATLLTDQPCSIDNVPAIEDVHLLLSLLESLGSTVDRKGALISVRTPSLTTSEASYSLVKSLRASFWVLAPLLVRCGQARVAVPGGDMIGARPVDIHLDALRQMGAEITVKQGVVVASAPDGLQPAHLKLRFPSVGATHQILMAAALTPGETVIEGAAREPEVVALANMLQEMGVDIDGAGESVITVTGVRKLGGCSVTLIGDRIEAGTYLLAGLSSRGRVTVRGVDPRHLAGFLEVLAEMGAVVSTTSDSVTAAYERPLRGIKITTGPFPAFATDLQSPIMALLATNQGKSLLEETVFEGRFGGVNELGRMGAVIFVQDHVAHVRGIERLAGAPVDGLDIRAAASLVVAALGAEGRTQIHEVHHLRRGYDALEEKLRSLGAKITLCIPDHEDYLAAGC